MSVPQRVCLGLLAWSLSLSNGTPLVLAFARTTTPTPTAAAAAAANRNGHHGGHHRWACWGRTTRTTAAADGRNLIALAATTAATDDASSTSVVSPENLALLSDRGRAAVEQLVLFDDDGEGDDDRGATAAPPTTDSGGNNNNNHRAQAHVYGNWPAAGVDDDGKRRLAEQLADLDASYPGGLATYLTKARLLLRDSADGTNPFADYVAAVPAGEILSPDDDDIAAAGGTMPFREAEDAGLDACATAVFVLVAGGLGERLGYSGIKLSLATNLCTNQCYLETYVQYILAMQYVARQRTGDDRLRIPLVIMTSGDTDAATRRLLADHGNFGMAADQIAIVTQDKVAALKDGAAGLALDDNDRWSVQTKPHGHGDVHHLLHREGLVAQWEKEGKTHVVFLQDTNALVINSVIPTLGVSVKKGFHMNSICIPRLAGEAAGAIARLEHRTDPDKSLVINVEYNQLDPLLRTQGDGKGDVADPQTGHSPFPGNANNLVIELSAYAKTLRGEDQGVVLEFVNPKYKDSTRTEFKKPTRLECMMQDIPKLFQKEMGAESHIGFTMFDRWFTFSPAKNSLEAGRDAVEGGNTSPGTMSSAESEMYIQNQKKLRQIGVDVHVTEDSDLVMISGIPVSPGPRIILCPAFGISKQEYASKVQGPVTITQRSSLVLDGHHLTIKGLELDGALVIRSAPDSHVTVDGLHVQNDGWELQELDPDTDYPETVRIRGYTVNKKETREYIINEPGHFIIDGAGEVKKID